MTTRRKNNKPRLIMVGKHLVNPNDIACISRIRKNLWIIKRLSEPNPEFPIWVTSEAQLQNLLDEFNIKVSDIPFEREDE